MMKIKYTIYIVDDDKSVARAIALTLKRNYEVKTFSDAESCINKVGKHTPDLVLLDIGLGKMDGLEALRIIKESHPNILVIMITGYENVNMAVKAMRLGAYDYINKPVNIDSLKLNVAKALDTIRLQKEVQTLQERSLKENTPYFVAESDAIKDVIQVVERVAKSHTTPVLILGESGVGKELIASSIHYRSPNFKGPFVTLNCATIPEDLIESELFGHEKGAFSGARAEGKQGLVEAAEHGTLFLDEVSELAPKAQAKLLRFLEDGTFYKIGGTKKIKIETRVIAATNENLISLVEEGRFRLDLYYRLAVVKIEVPSLNKRRDDIIPIAKHLITELNGRLGTSFSAISTKSAQALRKYEYRGNVRELKNIIERAMILGNGNTLKITDLEANCVGLKNHQGFSLPPLSKEGIDLPALKDTIEKQYIEKALELTDYNESAAAKLLNLKGPTFHYRRKRLKYTPDE